MNNNIYNGQNRFMNFNEFDMQVNTANNSASEGN